MKIKHGKYLAAYYLKTWVVGVNHYVPNLCKNSKVQIKREPGNPYDRNAVAVFNDKEECCGYLPRYDSRYFGPLLDQGAVEIELEPTGERHNERVSIILHVKVLPQGRFIYDELKSTGMEAVYHRAMVEVWQRVDTMSDGDINQFRSFLHDLVHADAVACETQFLYRMLKGVPEQRRIIENHKREQERLRGEQEQKERMAVARRTLSQAIGTVTTGAVIQCGRVLIVPLACSGPGMQMFYGDDAAKSGVLTFEFDGEREVIRAFNHGALPVLCPPAMEINDGFHLYLVIAPCVIPANGVADLEVTLKVVYDLSEKSPLRLLIRDAGCGEADIFTTDCGEIWLQVDISRNKEKMGHLQGCCGVAVFVDGMFDRLEIYPSEDVLLSAWKHKRLFSTYDGGQISEAQMFGIIERLICKATVTSESPVDNAPVTKSLDLALADLHGTALLAENRCVYLGFCR